jgi:hypothetical protein
MDFNYDSGTISSILILDPGSTNLTVTGNSGLVLPAGNTASRVATTGALRFSTDYSYLEYYNGTSWVAISFSGTASQAANTTALSNLAGTGFISQTAAGTFVERSITGTTGDIVVTNGNGVAGNVQIDLANAGTPGTYVRVTTDAFGRVTTGFTTMDWASVTGTPTTLTGYGITNAVTNFGNVAGEAAGTFSSMPTASSAANTFYYATDTGGSYYSNGTTWTLNEPALTGDVTNPVGSLVTTLATVNSNVGTFGNTTTIPVLTVNAKGLITAVSTATITGNISVTGGDLTMSGATGTAITNATLSTVNTNVGDFGDATHVATFTVDAKGRTLSAANVAIPLAVTIGGDATGSGTTSNTTSITLATVNGNTGFFGSANQVATFTVDGKGRTTAAGNVTITPAAIGAIATTELGAINGVATLDATGTLTLSQIPAALVGAMQFNGTWNATTGNTTSLTVPTISFTSNVAPAGEYFIVATAGTNTIGTLTGNVSQWNVGDMIISTGTAWEKIDGLSSEVTSVFGRVGAITATLASTDFADQGTTSTVLHGNANGAPSWGSVSLTSDVSGTLQATQFPALTGDITTLAGALGTTLATVNSNVGTFGTTLAVPVVTVNAKGLVTAVSTAVIPNTIALTGDATASVTTGGSGILTLATVNANVGSFGSASTVPVVTVDAKGLVTAVSTAAIPTTVALSGDVTSTGGTTSSNAVVTLNSVNSNIGTFGSTTQIPVVTVDAKGRVTAVSTATISGNIEVTGGDLTLSGSTGTAITNATLATVNANVGSFGTTSAVPVVTVNAKGLVTAVSTATITPAAIGAVANAGGAPSLAEGTFASMPAAGTTGRLFVATDTKSIYRDNGTTWDQVGEAGLLYTENASSPVASTVTGLNAITIGSDLIAAGNDSLVTGLSASTAIYGAEVRASGSFANPGDAQAGRYILRAATTGVTVTEALLDGSNARMVLPNHTGWTYVAKIVAQGDATAAAHGGWEIKGVVARGANAAATALVGNRSKTTLTAPVGWGCEVSADVTNGALVFNVTGASTTNIRWVITVETSEASF